MHLAILGTDLFAAAVEDGVMQHLELAKLADELDVAQHLALGNVPGKHDDVNLFLGFFLRAT